jgi:hypothetical protein
MIANQRNLGLHYRECGRCGNDSSFPYGCSGHVEPTLFSSGILRTADPAFNLIQPMNPVDLVNHRLRHSDIDYEFRPSSYWRPANDVLQAVLRDVKGIRRREMITEFFREGRLHELQAKKSENISFWKRWKPNLSFLAPAARCGGT